MDEPKELSDLITPTKNIPSHLSVDESPVDQQVTPSNEALITPDVPSDIPAPATSSEEYPTVEVPNCQPE